ncbi:MAG TPA: hypothetical protein VMH91_01235 [Candidatus Paceibacterota bacterium]|nr:hypothetical protein [Candidatus Paceibacterota bacterium]
MEFSAEASIRLGWETFKKRPWFLIGVPLLAVIIVGIVSAAFGELQKLGAVFALLVFVANIYVTTVYKMGATNFVLKAVENTETLQVMDYWQPHPFWRYLGAGILVGLCVLAAFILALVLSGLIAGVGYAIAGSAAAGVWFVIALVPLSIVFVGLVAIALVFVRYLVIARGLGPVEALEESARITKSHRWGILWFLVLCLLLNVLGLVCLIVGLLVTIPVTSLALVHAYRTLEQKAGSSVMA